MSAPKRFYQDVTIEPGENGFSIALDGRVAKTAGRYDLVAATETLAQALRDEWEEQTEFIRLEAMPLTRLHGFVLDAGEKGRIEFIDTIVSYAGSDLLCYRADDRHLADRQAALFDPFLDKARADGLHFVITEGLLPVDQPDATLVAIKTRATAMPTDELFPRKLLTEITGSAVLALYADTDPANAFTAARLDEAYQAEKWGLDAEAEVLEKARRRDFDHVLSYLALVSI
ncbi:MAG: ATP12 family protein [Pseudomonadota bacterium]